MSSGVSASSWPCSGDRAGQRLALTRGRSASVPAAVGCRAMLDRRCSFVCSTLESWRQLLTQHSSERLLEWFAAGTDVLVQGFVDQRLVIPSARGVHLRAKLDSTRAGKPCEHPDVQSRAKRNPGGDLRRVRSVRHNASLTIPVGRNCVLPGRAGPPARQPRWGASSGLWPELNPAGNRQSDTAMLRAATLTSQGPTPYVVCAIGVVCGWSLPATSKASRFFHSLYTAG